MSKDEEITVEQLLASVEAGNQSGESKSPREILADMFRPTDYVTIKNVTGKPFAWVYVQPDEERVEQPDRYTRRVFHPKPKGRVLRAGQKITIPGWEAYLALTNMVKQYQREMGKSFSLSNVSQVEGFFSRAYLGIFDPNAEKATETNTMTEEPLKEATEADDKDDLKFAKEDNKKG